MGSSPTKRRKPEPEIISPERAARLDRAQRWLEHTRAEGIALGVKDCFCDECMHYTHQPGSTYDMTDDSKLGIHKAICAIKLAIAGGGGIGKDKKAPMGYMFRGIEAFDNILCGLTAEHNVNAYPRILSKEIIHGQTAKGGYQSHAIVEIEWTYVCATDGSTQIASTIGEAMDTQDKVFNKAMQASRKYADVMVFRIPVGGDDTEVYTPEASVQHEQQAPAQTQQEPPAARRTRGPNKPKEEQATPQQQAPTAQEVAKSFTSPPAEISNPQAVLNGNAPAEPPFPEGAGANPTTDIAGLISRIASVNTFPVLYATAQDVEASLPADGPDKQNVFHAIKMRAMHLFGIASDMKGVQEGFELVNALGQPADLRSAANKAFAKFRATPNGAAR